MVQGLFFDPRAIPGEGGAVWDREARGPSNASPIVVFWAGGSSVRYAVNVIAHEIGHFKWGTDMHALPYAYGDMAEELYRNNR
jgi:hypothetical protein